jgi:hypothetical protein
MRIQTKPVIALASGAILLGSVGSVLCQTAQAQSVIIPWTTVPLADVVGVATGPDALAVAYEVTENPFDGVYTYSYTVDNPSGDPAIVEAFSIGFNTSPAGAVLTGSVMGGAAWANTGTGLLWVDIITPGNNSGTLYGGVSLSFESYDVPTYGNADATGSDNPPSPWASDPYGSQVPVPNTVVVPEPTTTALLALTALLLLPFRSTILKRELMR